MARAIHVFRTPDRFVAGTVGEPGDRVFYLQAVHESRVVVRPVLQRPPLEVERVEGGAVLADEERQDGEQHTGEAGPGHGARAGGGSHPRSMPKPIPPPHARTDSLPL